MTPTTLLLLLLLLLLLHTFLPVLLLPRVGTRLVGHGDRRMRRARRGMRRRTRRRRSSGGVEMKEKDTMWEAGGRAGGRKRRNNGQLWSDGRRCWRRRRTSGREKGRGRLHSIQSLIGRQNGRLKVRRRGGGREGGREGPLHDCMSSRVILMRGGRRREGVSKGTSGSALLHPRFLTLMFLGRGRERLLSWQEREGSWAFGTWRGREGGREGEGR